MMKVKAVNGNRAEIVTLANVFNAKVVDVSINAMIVEMTGTPPKVDNLIEVLEPFGIQEMMRTGRISMVRGERSYRGSDTLAENRHGDYAAENGHMVKTLN